MLSSQEAPIHSVLVLGSTQAGKSALIQHIKRYANPGYAMDESLLGNGITPKTESIQPFLFNSDLPEYEVYEAGSRELINVKELATKYHNEEDYRDKLLTRPSKAIMREVQRAPSNFLKFQFFDTPGLNGTKGKDSEYADKIKQLITTQSFNLIVFVFSSKNPVTEEKHYALEYYASILYGLHSKIVFLYTHVDYSDMHPSNGPHHLNMTMRNKTFSTIFRPYAEKHIDMYPSLHIDLDTKNRPVIQCLIRKTIRELLLMANGPPAALDTRKIQRSDSIKYSAIFNPEQRTEFEAQLRAGLPEPVSGQSQGSQENPKHSILLLGKTQSGKSRLIQHILNYADPNYSIDISLLGNGNTSKTDTTRSFFVQSHLPAYQAFRKDTGEVIDLKDLATRCEEEDYRDILFSREKDVDLRLAPHDPNAPPELVKFEFLDTPGLNDTNSRDLSHSANIIDEMIKVQSFSLIIIIVSYSSPVTMEQHLALDYYAEVLQGMHSRILFLHTHVDYSEIHSSNADHEAKLMGRNNDLKNIFRHHATDKSSSREDTKEYRSLTIDLVSKKRPVINCLIRNTIREILLLATKTPVAFDTRLENIERIRAISHPSNFSDEQYKKVKARYLAEAAATRNQKPPGVVHGEVNILLIGDVESRKTALIKAFRSYANGIYEDNTEGYSRIVDGDVKITEFLSDLHTIQISKLREDRNEYNAIDLDVEAMKSSEEYFKSLFHLGPKEATVSILTHGSKKYRFKIYEVPSLNMSDKGLEKYIFNSHRSLFESRIKFHQVLFTLASDTKTSSFENTIQVYSDIFSDLSPLFSLIHTKIDYSLLHISSKNFQDAVKKTLDLFELHTQSKATSYLINCDIPSDLPVQRGKTYLVVRNILFNAATNQEPVSLKSSFIRKTPKVVSIDSQLKWENRGALETIKDEIRTTGKELSELKCRIRQLSNEYNKASDLKNFAKNNDITSRNDMEVVFEERYAATADPSLEIGWRNMTCRRLPRTIETVHVVCENIDIKNTPQSGEGYNKWKIFYRHMSPGPAILDAKLYAKKLDSDSRPVGETPDMMAIRHRRADLERKHDVVALRFKDQLKEKEKYWLLRFCIFRATLPQTVYEALATAVASNIQANLVHRIKEIYLQSESTFGKDPYAVDVEAVGSVGKVGSGFLKQYSILMFGKTQAGKSTFIEFVKNYADRKYKIDESLIGTGVKSKTGRPTCFSIRSSLPSYQVVDIIESTEGVDSTKKPKPVDITNLDKECKDVDDYTDALRNRKVTVEKVGEEDHPDKPSPSQCEFSFLDTPGIEDTNGRDTEHAPKIIHEMAKMRAFNLIIIVVNCKDQPSISQQLGFGYYSKIIKILQGCHSNIVFVYTNVDYAQCHHTNTDFNKNMDLRHKAFSSLFRGCSQKGDKAGANEQNSFCRTNFRDEDVELYPMFKIDLSRRHRPIPSCMLLRTLQKILQLAVKTEPMKMDTIMENLLQVYGISHPDEMNQMQRERHLKPLTAILEERPDGGDVTVPKLARGKDDEAKHVGKVVHCFDSLENDEEDYEECYFDGPLLLNDQNSEDED